MGKSFQFRLDPWSGRVTPNPPEEDLDENFHDNGIPLDHITNKPTKFFPTNIFWPCGVGVPEATVGTVEVKVAI